MRRYMVNMVAIELLIVFAVVLLFVGTTAGFKLAILCFFLALVLGLIEGLKFFKETSSLREASPRDQPKDKE